MKVERRGLFPTLASSQCASLSERERGQETLVNLSLVANRSLHEPVETTQR